MEKLKSYKTEIKYESLCYTDSKGNKDIQGIPNDIRELMMSDSMKGIMNDMLSNNVYYEISISVKPINIKENKSPLFVLNGKDIFEEDCSEEFLAYFTCQECVNDDGTIYTFDGMCIDMEGNVLESDY